MNPKKRISVHQFSTFDSFMESRWKGRESEWIAISTNLDVIMSYLKPNSTLSALDLSPDPEFYGLEVAIVGAEIAETHWHVLVGAESPAQQRRIQLAAKEKGIASDIATIEIVDPRDLSRFPDQSIDVVLALGLLHRYGYSQDMAEIGSEIARVLNPDGYVFVSVNSRGYAVVADLSNPTTWDDIENFKSLAMLAKGRAYRTTGSERELASYQSCTMDQLVMLFETSGLELLEIIASSGIAAWIPFDTWERIRMLGEQAFDLAYTLISTVNEEPTTVGLSPEFLFVGRGKS